MKIISKFSDYYDSCMSFGVDPKCIYIRDTKEFDSEEKGWPVDIDIKLTKEGWWKRYHDFDCGIVVFCGELFPYIVMEHIANDRTILKNGGKVIYERWESESIKYFCYCMEHVEKHVLDFWKKDEIAEFFKVEHKKRWRRKSNESRHDNMSKFFSINQSLLTREYIVDMHHQAGSPCFVVVGNRHNANKKLIINPRLSDFQFYRTRFDPFRAFQEIFMFISGVMGGKAPPMLAVSDKIRKEKHGFDERSFRNTGGRLK
jgi:hypothetical protein